MDALINFDEISIKSALLDIDRKLRPQLLIIHPSRLQELVQLVPNIEEQVKLFPTSAVSEDMIYLVDREEIEGRCFYDQIISDNSILQHT